MTLEILNDPTLRTVALGGVVLGLGSGAVGAYVLLRQRSLLGDAVSHATLPGIALAFLLTRSKEPAVLLGGALLAGWLGSWLVEAITRTTRVKLDSALGLVLSVFFGLGIVLLTFLQRYPEAGQAGLNRFLFGQAASIRQQDVLVMALGASAILLTIGLLWKELKTIAFDPEFAESSGLPARALGLILDTLTVLAIVVGLHMVGVVLMSAMLVAPAAAARQWTDRLDRMVPLSAFFGILASVGGALFSALIPRLPTGPAIVLVMGTLVFLSLLAAPNRGLLWPGRARGRPGFPKAERESP